MHGLRANERSVESRVPVDISGPGTRGGAATELVRVRSRIMSIGMHRMELRLSQAASRSAKRGMQVSDNETCTFDRFTSKLHKGLKGLLISGKDTRFFIYAITLLYSVSV